MTQFKKLKSTDTIEEEYFKRVIVFLESDEDLIILQDRWFFNLGEFLDFRSADDGKGGGATQVIKNVEKANQEGMSAFGIVDRDSLMAHGKWDLWWEIDDTVFGDAKPFGEFIKVLKRWELENYLLVPEILEEVLADKEQRYRRSQKEVIDDLLQQSDDFKLLSAAAIIFHQNASSFGLKFDSIPDSLIMRNEIEKNISLKIDPQLIRLIDHYKEKIDVFSEGKNGKERWERLSRMLDGKRVLRRLRLLGKPQLKTAYCLMIASRLHNRIDPELLNYIDEFKAALPL